MGLAFLPGECRVLYTSKYEVIVVSYDMVDTGTPSTHFYKTPRLQILFFYAALHLIFKVCTPDSPGTRYQDLVWYAGTGI